jgi:hypothetical protein
LKRTVTKSVSCTKVDCFNVEELDGLIFGGDVTTVFTRL